MMPQISAEFKMMKQKIKRQPHQQKQQKQTDNIFSIGFQGAPLPFRACYGACIIIPVFFRLVNAHFCRKALSEFAGRAYAETEGDARVRPALSLHHKRAYTTKGTIFP